MVYAQRVIIETAPLFVVAGVSVVLNKTTLFWALLIIGLLFLGGVGYGLKKPR
jgi:hypothetical protein